MKKPLSIFTIVKREIEGLKIKAIFLEYDFENAKLWLQGYLKDEKYTDPRDYILYKIGEIDNELKIKGFKIYVTNGDKVIEKKKSLSQLKFENWDKIMNAKKEKERLNNIKKLYENGADISEVIKETFKGRII